MEHNLVTELRVLANTLENWEHHIEISMYKVTPEQAAKWQIGVESDILNALEHIRKHFNTITQ